MRPYTTVSTASRRVSDLPGCGGCGLHRLAKSPKMKPTGKCKREILFIAEAPGEVEDTEGEQLIGPAGQFLREQLVRLGVDLDTDAAKTNACCCRPPKNRTPEPEEIAFCRPNVLACIKQYRPKVIFLLGGSPLRSLYGHRCKFDMAIHQWRGARIPDYEMGAYVVPTFHPSYLKRTEHDNHKLLVRLFRKDIQRGLDALEWAKSRPEDIKSEARSLCSLPSSDDAAKMLLRIVERARNANGEAQTVAAFDYETTGIKPDAAGHGIFVASVATNLDGRSFSFFVNEKTKDALIAFLAEPRIRKIAHNHKFESRWSRAVLNQPVRGWYWDTCNVQHMLDNRQGVTGLKFQVAIRYGDLDYASLAKSDDNWKGSTNKIHNYSSVDYDCLRLYNALDSLYTLWLYQDQMIEVSRIVRTFGKNPLLRDQADGFLDGCRLTMAMSACFEQMEINGMRVDTEYLNKCDSLLAKMVHEAREEFLATKVGKVWRAKFGVVKVDSPKHMRTVLYKHLGFEPPKLTEGEEESTDKEALLTLNDPDLVKLLELKKLMKARGTYVKQIKREAVHGVIHPSFSLNIARTFRSSCHDPNLQNVPIRDKNVGRIIRTAFIPDSPDECLAETDLKGAEVCVEACYNEDPHLVAYVEDTSLDMHRDSAMKLFQLTLEEFNASQSKENNIRHCGKNMWVFPQFYGDWYGSCHKALWHAALNLTVGADKIPMRTWLADKGMATITDFEKHTEGVERYFWDEMFGRFSEWKDEWWEEYLRRGYFDTFTGFRCTAVMDKKKATNYPIQGDAFHLEGWITNEVRKRIRDYETLRKRVKLLNLIHDSLIASVHQEAVREYARLMMEVVASCRDRFPWIIVPIRAEIEIAPPGKSWYEKKPYELETVQ